MHKSLLLTALSPVLCLCLCLPTLAQEVKIQVAPTSPLYKRVKQYLPGDTKETYRMRHSGTFVKAGWDAFKENKFDAALDSFFQAVNMNGNDAKAYASIAHVCCVQGNLEDGIIFYRAALQLEKKQQSIYHNLARCLCMKYGQSPPDEVKTLLDEAIKLSPNSSNSYITYGGYYCLKNDWVKAGKMYQKGLDLGAEPDPRGIEQLKQHGIVLKVKKK